MVNVNKKYFENELKTRAWDRFLKALIKSGSAEKLSSNLRTFLTGSELAVLEKRLLILILLEEGLSYRTIEEKLGVCPATISFVKHNLTKKPAVHKKQVSTYKPESDNRSFGPLMSPSEHLRRMRRS